MSSGLVVPSIQVDNELLLRGFTGADAPMVVEASRDPYIPTFTKVVANCDLREAEVTISYFLRRSELTEGYPFAIVDTLTNRAPGQIGLWLPDDEMPFAGYWLVPDARGRGAAARCLRALCGWAFSDLDLRELRLYVEPWNDASLLTAERAGFKRLSTVSRKKTDGTKVEMHEFVRSTPQPARLDVDLKDSLSRSGRL